MTGSPSFTSFSVPAAFDSIRPATKILLDTAQTWGVLAAADGLFEVALGEIIINAVKHGGERPEAEIHCELELVDGAFLVRVFDAGAGFDPGSVAPPSPQRDEPDRLAETGYGLAIVHAVFTSVKPVRRDGLFGVELMLNLDVPRASSAG